MASLIDAWNNPVVSILYTGFQLISYIHNYSNLTYSTNRTIEAGIA